jgi:hypothetical protein
MMWCGTCARGPCAANLFLNANRTREAITASRQCLNPALTAGLLGEHAPQCGNLNGQVAFLDGKAAPCDRDQRILGNGRTRVLHKYAQQRDRPPA